MKILMVCLGNICRSPMADGIMRSISTERKMGLEVDSAGTASYHIGSQPDSRMISTAKEHNIDITNLRARQFQRDDFENYDLIYVMDQSNYENVLALNDHKPHPKVKLILNEIEPGANHEVPDPYYGGDEGFENVFQMLNEACNIIADKIERNEF